MRYKVIVSYDGTLFDGYQIQKDKRTIQNEIQIALAKLYQKEIKISSSGRTDKGVHAYGQVFSYETEKEIEPYKIKKALNTYLPKDVSIINVNKVDDSFHPRGSIKNKEYVYKINIGTFNPIERNYVYQHGYDLDVKKLKKAAKLFVGTHNFKNFCTNDEEEKKTYVRTVNKISISKKDDIIIISIVGTGFLRYMVRMIIGTMIAYNDGKVDLDNIKFSLDERCPNRTIYKVPSEGLYLMKVTYPQR
ncbi:MAG: tRNA pseudouridine(38-40) synthase TruA [Erysipelotrichaceae bacterium]|nr:tRNA pseudouridine(38-40) synthase TruA [Erysipelotrichaceae bacterium]